MARSTRETTKNTIMEARAADPLALGPLLGELALNIGLTAPMIAESLDAHEQTVVRWFTSKSPIAPMWGLRVAKLIVFLAWMRENEWPPLTGPTADRHRQLAAAGKVYKEIASTSGSSRTKATV